MTNMLLRTSRVLTGGPGSRGYVAAATYTGPGDIVSGARGYYGLRAYNAAYATGSNPAIDVYKSDGSVGPTTINILSNGDLDVATISGLGYAVVISKLYDHTGNGNHMVQTTNANRPTLTLSGIGSKPVMTFAGSHWLVATASDTTQVWTMFAVAKTTVNPGDNSYQEIFSGQGTGSGLWFRNVSGNPQVDFYAGTDALKSTPINTWYALGFVGNGASSILGINGVDQNTGQNPGTRGTGTNWAIGADPTTEPLTGAMVEAGVYPSGLTSGQIASLAANQQTYWGF